MNKRQVNILVTDDEYKEIRKRMVTKDGDVISMAEVVRRALFPDNNHNDKQDSEPVKTVINKTVTNDSVPDNKQDSEPDNEQDNDNKEKFTIGGLTVSF